MDSKNIDASILDSLSPEGVADLDIALLADFQDEIADAETLWDNRKKALQFALDMRFGERATQHRLDDGKDTGTVKLAEGELSVACELVKRVEWDQDKMVAIRDRILAGGGDPFAYMRARYDMTETSYNQLQAEVRAVFLPARTVRPQKPKYIITDPKAAKKRSGR